MDYWNSWNITSVTCSDYVVTEIYYYKGSVTGTKGYVMTPVGLYKKLMSHPTLVPSQFI